MRVSRGLIGKTPWGDPEGWFLFSYLVGGLLEGDAHVPQPKLFTNYSLHQKVWGQEEPWWPGSRLLSHLLHTGGEDPGMQLHRHAQVATGASGVQWNVQPLYSVMLIHTRVLLKYGLLSYPKSTLANTLSNFQLVALKNRVVAVSPLLKK